MTINTQIMYMPEGEDHLVYIMPGELAAAVKGKLRRRVLDEIAALQLTHHADAIPHVIARDSMKPLDLQKNYDTMISMGVIRKFVIAIPKRDETE